MFKKHAVLLCLAATIILMIIAASGYPGGSILDKNSEGFHWTKNFISNLFQEKALNGMDNPYWMWAVVGAAFHSLGSGLFFIHMSKKMPSKHAAMVLKVVGTAEILFNFLIATSLHDIMVVISSTLSLLGLFYITVFLLKTKLHVFKICSIACMLTFYYTLFLYGSGDWGLLAIMQKVSFIISMLLILGLEYFTRKEDFDPKQAT
ncbi:MAG: hypothetical protein JNJ57_03580 [Saprospiraceae bacterium]|nr:hypothetical protein [Saprospiraceae bacterium]